MNEFSVIVEVPCKQSFLSQGPRLGCRGRRCGVSVGGEELGPRLPPGPAGASALRWAAGAESRAAPAAGPEPRAASRRRRCVPAQPSAAPRLPHAPTHRRGDPGGGRGRARPREGKGPVLPEPAAAAAQEAEAAAAAAAEAATCPPQSPAASDPRPPVRQPAPRRGALSTARGEYLPRRPPRAARAVRRAGVAADPLARRLSAALAQPGPPQLSGCSGAHGSSGAPRPAEVPGQPGRWTGPLRESPSQAPGLGFPVRLRSNDPEVCSPARDKCMSRKRRGRAWTDCVWVVSWPGWFSEGALPQSDRGGTGSPNPAHALGRASRGNRGAAAGIPGRGRNGTRSLLEAPFLSSSSSALGLRWSSPPGSVRERAGVLALAAVGGET